MFKKILVPIDGSLHSDKAEQKAIELARQMGAEVTLIHVIIPPQYTAFFGETPIPISRDIMDELENRGTKLLTEHAATHAGAGTKLTTQLYIGHPAETICKRAKEDNYDLIIIGSRGLGAIKGYLLGSVSDRVSHHAPCSVLIVKNKPC